MKKTSFQKLLFTQAVLASTLFCTPVAHAVPIAAPTAGPINTSASATKSFEIQTTGSVTGTNANGIVMDFNNSAVTIDPNNNFGNNAISTNGAGIISGIVVQAGFTGSKVSIGENSGITNTGTNALSTAITANSEINLTNKGNILGSGAGSFGALLLNTAPNSTIDNFGTIVANNTALFPIAINSPSTNVLINNELGGTIQSNAGGAETISYVAGGSGLILNNGGSIVQTNAKTNVNLLSPFVTLTNESLGVIKQQAGGAGTFVINVAGGAGSITNEQNASIIGTTAGTAGIGVNTLALTGSILNAGNISTVNTSALLIDKSITGTITNDLTGTISTQVPTLATIHANSAGVVISGGIINRGNILGLGGKALDLGTNSAAAKFTQENGSVFGDVYLAARDGDNIAGKQDVFVMTGGVINGNVIAKTSAGDTNVLDLSGGTISGNVTLGDNGDTVFLNDTDIVGNLFGGAGDDTINVKGGSFGALDGKGGTANTLNILDTFTANGPINNMNQINVKNPGTIFTLNKDITNMDAAFAPGLTIDKGTQMVLNANISGKGDVRNNGRLTVQNNALIDLSAGAGVVVNTGVLALDTKVLTITSDTAGAFRNLSGGVVQVNTNGLQTPGGVLSNGQLVVNSTQPAGIRLDSGSFIQPIATGFIPQGAKFDVMTISAPGTITNPLVSSLIQPSSAVIFFRQELNATNDILSLVGQRRSFESLSSTQVTKGIAGALDTLAAGNGPNNAELLNLLVNLDGLATQAEVEAAMESLIPPFNFGLVAGSRIGMNSAFESVIIRLEDLYARKKGRHVEVVEEVQTQKGVSYGDPASGGSVWAKALGAHLNQRERGGVEGYKAKGGGIAVGADWGVNDCTTLGLAGSYTKVNVDDKNASPKDQDIKSWQATGYGWWEFQDGIYLDAMLGVSTNRYKLNRVINVNEIHTAANSSFHGTQWGAQADLGWSLCNSTDYYFAPFARLRYIHLDLDDYTESGAAGLSLNVQNEDVKEFLGGLGFRLGYTYQACDVLYVPEISLMLGYDFQNDGEQTFAGFLAGGPAFGTDGIKPGRTIFDLGLMLDAHVSNCSIFTAKYNLELRSEFVSNAFYLQYNYLWS